MPVPASPPDILFVTETQQDAPEYHRGKNIFQYVYNPHYILPMWSLRGLPVVSALAPIHPITNITSHTQ